jgi:hypothetical protein
MNQHPPVPAIGLTLCQPKEKVEQAIDKMIEKGRSMLQRKADSREMMEQLKRFNWSWVIETSDGLKGLFSSESVPQYFSSNVYFVPSLKADEFERDLDEFPYLVTGRLDRLNGFRKMAAVVPEPPCNDFIASLLHPAIYHATWRPFELGQYGQAVALAVKELDDAVSLKVSGKYNATGAELVRAAFDIEEGILNTPENTEVDNQGIADLMAGFFERYKNLPSSAPISIQQASRVMSLASYLMYTLDNIILIAPESEDKPKEEPYQFEFLKD